MMKTVRDNLTNLDNPLKESGIDRSRAGGQDLLASLAKISIDHNHTRRDLRACEPKIETGIRFEIDKTLTEFNNDPQKRNLLPKDRALELDKRILAAVTKAREQRGI